MRIIFIKTNSLAVLLSLSKEGQKEVLKKEVGMSHFDELSVTRESFCPPEFIQGWTVWKFEIRSWKVTLR